MLPVPNVWFADGRLSHVGILKSGGSVQDHSDLHGPAVLNKLFSTLRTGRKFFDCSKR